MDTALDTIYGFSYFGAAYLFIILFSSLLLDCLDTCVLHKNLMTLNGDLNEVVPVAQLCRTSKKNEKDKLTEPQTASPFINL